jgi:hypothetical protein
MDVLPLMMMIQWMTHNHSELFVVSVGTSRV